MILIWNEHRLGIGRDSQDEFFSVGHAEQNNFGGRQVGLSHRQNRILTPSLSSESLFEPASKVWTRFVEGELRITDKIQQQIMHVGSVSRQENRFDEMLHRPLLASTTIDRWRHWWFSFESPSTSRDESQT